MIDAEITIRFTGLEDTPQGFADYLDHYLRLASSENIISLTITESDEEND